MEEYDVYDWKAHWLPVQEMKQAHIKRDIKISEYCG